MILFNFVKEMLFNAQRRGQLQEPITKHQFEILFSMKKPKYDYSGFIFYIFTKEFQMFKILIKISIVKQFLEKFETNW